jgi:hypothetical protein
MQIKALFLALALMVCSSEAFFSFLKKPAAPAKAVKGSKPATKAVAKATKTKVMTCLSQRTEIQSTRELKRCSFNLTTHPSHAPLSTKT